MRWANPLGGRGGGTQSRLLEELYETCIRSARLLDLVPAHTGHQLLRVAQIPVVVMLRGKRTCTDAQHPCRENRYRFNLWHFHRFLIHPIGQPVVIRSSSFFGRLGRFSADGSRRVISLPTSDKLDMPFARKHDVGKYIYGEA